MCIKQYQTDRSTLLVEQNSRTTTGNDQQVILIEINTGHVTSCALQLLQTQVEGQS